MPMPVFPDIELSQIAHNMSDTESDTEVIKINVSIDLYNIGI